MKRRDFLKLIGVASIAPSVLAVMPKADPFAGDVMVENLAPFESTEMGWTYVSANPTGTDYVYDSWVFYHPEHKGFLVCNTQNT